MVLRGSTSTLVGKAHRHGLRFHKANQPGYALERNAILGNAAGTALSLGLALPYSDRIQATSAPDPMGG
jgi:hypothetical protein